MLYTCFTRSKKKSKKGITTLKAEINLIEKRMKDLVKEREGDNDKTSAANDPMRNVWLQLGLPDAEEHFLKAELVLRLDKAIKLLGLTQRAAARRIGTTQPELSKILGGKSPRFRWNG